MVYSSKDKIKKVEVTTPGLTQEVGFGDKTSRVATTKGQREPKIGFSKPPMRKQAGIGGVASGVRPGLQETKPTAGASVPVKEAVRAQDRKDVFAMKPDEWKRAQEKILGKGRV